MIVAQEDRTYQWNVQSFFQQNDDKSLYLIFNFVRDDIYDSLILNFENLQISQFYY